MVGHVEASRVNVTVDADRLCQALGQQLDLVVRRPFVSRSRQVDAGHARCGGYVQRRLSSEWEVRREVEIVHGRSHGWIDVLAFNSGTATLLVVEIKTEIHDVGRIERTVGWYRREAWAAGRPFGWRPRRLTTWLIVLATSANDERIRENREALGQSFVGLGMSMLEPDSPATGLAMIDPRSRRRDWLLKPSSHGRRTPAPYRDYGDFVRRIEGGG